MVFVNAGKSLKEPVINEQPFKLRVCVNAGKSLNEPVIDEQSSKPRMRVNGGKSLNFVFNLELVLLL